MTVAMPDHATRDISSATATLRDTRWAFAASSGRTSEDERWIQPGMPSRPIWTIARAYRVMPGGLYLLPEDGAEEAELEAELKVVPGLGAAAFWEFENSLEQLQ